MSLPLNIENTENIFKGKYNLSFLYVYRNKTFMFYHNIYGICPEIFFMMALLTMLMQYSKVLIVILLLARDIEHI